jgi:hypothetical protein
LTYVDRRFSKSPILIADVPGVIVNRFLHVAEFIEDALKLGSNWCHRGHGSRRFREAMHEMVWSWAVLTLAHLGRISNFLHNFKTGETRPLTVCMGVYY